MKNKIKYLIEYVKEYGFYLAILHYGVEQLNHFISNEKISKIRIIINYIKENRIKKEFIETIKDLESKYEFCHKKNEKQIFIYWDGPNEPIIDMCNKSVKANSKNVKIINLNKENLNDYYEIDSLYETKIKNGFLDKIHFSDILRYELLYKYGGCWLDATMLVTGDIDYVFDDDFWTIKLSKEKVKCEYVSGERWYIYAMSCSANNKLAYYLKELYKQYFKKHNVVIDYFLTDMFIDILYNEDEEIKEMIDDCPINNKDSEKLFKNLYKNRNMDFLKELDANIFKLTYKIKPPKNIDLKSTLFYKIRNSLD